MKHHVSIYDILTKLQFYALLCGGSRFLGDIDGPFDSQKIQQKYHLFYDKLYIHCWVDV